MLQNTNTKEMKITMVHNYIINNPGKPQWRIAYSLGFRPSSKIAFQIRSLKKKGLIEKKSDGWYPKSRSPRMTNEDKKLIRSTVLTFPKSRKEFVSELKSTGLTKHQIYKQLDILVEKGEILKIKPNLFDQRQVAYCLSGSFSDV